jgi:hypothetical protein
VGHQWWVEAHILVSFQMEQTLHSSVQIDANDAEMKKKFNIFDSVPKYTKFAYITARQKKFPLLVSHSKSLMESLP